MKKTITLILLLSLLNVNAQIGGGWDWAFNTGSFGGTTFKHLKYTADGSEILMGGQALAAAYFGHTTLTAPPQLSYAGNIKFFGKINAATNAQTITRSFINIPVNFDCVTTDDEGNFYTGGATAGIVDFDLGNGVVIPGSATNSSVIIKFDSAGTALWAKVFPMGTVGNTQTGILKLAISNAGDIFFWGFNFSANNYPLYKLDSNGNTLWYKDAINNTGIVSNIIKESYLSDKFIDDNENVHLFVSTSSALGFAFDGVSYPTTNASAGSSTLISLNTNGDLLRGVTFQGSVTNFQVNRTTGNLIFGWNQLNPNPGAFQLLPHPFSAVSPYYANAFTGMMETDKNLNFVKAKDYSTTLDNPFQITGNGNEFLSLPNGKLIIAMSFANTATYSAGVNSGYPSDATNYATAIIETDTNWNIEKFITGGKAPTVGQTFLTAFNDTYLVGAGFYSESVLNTTSNPPLPTTSFGTVNLTGRNAASNFSTYSFASGQAFYYDVALAQCKSANFPAIASTTWLGASTNWNDPINWTNGIPTNAMKALFNMPTANYPTVSTAPTAASLEVNSGVTLPLPNTLILTGGVKNEGIITINNAGFFQGLGTKEWRGNGTVNFTGAAVTFYFGNLFTNSLVLNTNLTTQYNLTIPTISLNGSKVNLNSKKLSLTNPSPSAVSGANATNYVYGGTLERAINTTGVYEFPVGTNTNFQSATVDANALVGVTKIATTFNSGAITGTTPAISYGGTTIDTALNAGSFTITPNAQPNAGTFDVTLNLKGSSNSVVDPEKYTLIKRDNSTSAWSVQGTGTLSAINGGTVITKILSLTSFSDFAVGIGTDKITLGTTGLKKEMMKFTLFPNPTTSNLNINLSNSIENGNLKIISLLGQTVLEKQNLSGTDFNFDVSNLSQGLYVLELKNKGLEFKSKFIKQ